MVEKGLGYTILTYAAVRDEVEHRRLTAYPIERPAISTKVTIVTLRDKQLPKLTRDAGEMLHAVCGELVRNKAWAGARLA
jgi:LysR family nitrogen assimilation transcriptional regulator